MANQIEILKANGYISNAMKFGNETYRVRIRYNLRSDAWFIDFLDVVMGVKIVNGIDILRQYKHRAVPQGRLFAQKLSGRESKPTFDTINDSIVFLYEAE